MPSIKTAVFAALLGLIACGEDDPVCPEAGEEGPPTAATCTDDTLTYENFGQKFMQDYCTRCHSQSLQGSDERSCAPADHDFDSLDEIVLYREHIDETTAIGPNASNHAMPPNGAKPTDEERTKLGIWLACEEDRM